MRHVVATIAAALCWSGFSLGIEVPGEPVPRTVALDGAHWRAGDVVFRRGTGIEASVVETLDGSGYTHVGILAGASPKWTVIHVEPEEEGGRGRVEEIPLSEFASASKATALMVLPGTRREAIAAAAIVSARAQLGKPFDGQYRYSTDDALYCTELVGKAYAAAGDQFVEPESGVEIVMLRERLILPETLATALHQRNAYAARRS